MVYHKARNTEAFWTCDECGATTKRPTADGWMPSRVNDDSPDLCCWECVKKRVLASNDNPAMAALEQIAGMIDDDSSEPGSVGEYIEYIGMGLAELKAQASEAIAALGRLADQVDGAGTLGPIEQCEACVSDGLTRLKEKAALSEELLAACRDMADQKVTLDVPKFRRALMAYDKEHGKAEPTEKHRCITCQHFQDSKHEQKCADCRMGRGPSPWQAKEPKVWSPETTPRDALVTYCYDRGGDIISKVAHWRGDIVWVEYCDKSLCGITAYDPKAQKARDISNIELPKPENPWRSCVDDPPETTDRYLVNDKSTIFHSVYTVGKGWSNLRRPPILYWMPDIPLPESNDEV